MGGCLLEKTSLNNDHGDDTGKVMLMLGKVQFQIQDLVDNYRAHISLYTQVQFAFVAGITIMILLIPDAFIYGGCSQIKFTPGSPYESNLNSLLTSLVNSATYSSYNKYSISGSTQQDIINGLYQCRGDLAMLDCATCVARAVTQLAPLCSQTCGGAVQLEGCFVKYDNTSFIGTEDKTIVMKKCAPSAGYDPEVMGRRDAMLASLGSAGGLYRVGGANDVEGVAQCVGDLSNGKCQDCVMEAIEKLKSECGGAVFGDMFLGKCYARYSTSGAHAYARSHHGEHDEAEKTFAIIVGLLAGVALIIIFLTFMRKAFGRNGK